MLNEEQIIEEARKRIKSMDPNEKKAMEDEINEGLDLTFKIINQGEKSLTREERDKFYKFESKNVRNASGHSVENAEVEHELMSKLHLTKEEIKNMKKNPFKAGMLRQVILVALANVGLVATYGISKATGMDLNVAYPILSGLSGLFAFGFGKQLLNASRFKSLQKSYENENYQEKEINAAVYRELKEEIKRGRGL